MTMPKDLTDLKEGDQIDPRQFENISKNPELIERYSSPPHGNKKGQKKIMCIVLTAVKGAMPTLVAKPVKRKYGERWFSANKGTYFINYHALIDIGRTYLYMTTEDNAVGACYLAEHQEFADANQVELMTNQHAVEVFKKHKGIPVKLLLIVGIIALIGVMISAVVIINLVGASNALTNEKVRTTNLSNDLSRYKSLYGELPPLPPPTTTK